MLDNELKQVQRAINQAALNLDNRLNRIVNSMYYFFFLFGRRDQTFDRRFGR